MSDIVERLRAEATDNRRYEVSGTLATEAAARIEQLESALRDIIIHCDWPDRVEKYARAALEVHSIGHEDGLCPRERA